MYSCRVPSTGTVAVPFLLDAALGFVVARTSHAMRSSFRETVSTAGHDITPEEWGLLSRLWEQDGQRPAELAESTLRDRSTVTRLLDRMVEKGLARREVDPEDRRGMQTWLTPAGRAAAGRTGPRHRGSPAAHYRRDLRA